MKQNSYSEGLIHRMTILEQIPYKVKATYVVEVEEEVLARTPEEAEMLVESGESEFKDRMKELELEAEVLEIYAFPAEEEEL